MSAPPHEQQPGLKHWRAFDADEWRHVNEGAHGLALGSALPVVFFYATYRLWDFIPAVLAVLVWSAVVFAWHRRRTGGADVFSGATFGFACVNATIGLLTRSPALYLAAPSLENVIYGLVLLGSALAGKPLLAQFAQRLYPIPRHVQRSAAYRRAFVFTSLVWFTGLFGRALVRLWLISLWLGGILSLELYLVLNTVSGWPFNVSLVAFTVWYPLRALRKAGLTYVPPAEVHAVEESIEEAAPGVP